MSDETKPQMPSELQPFMRSVEAAEGPVTDADRAKMVQSAHASPDGKVQFIDHEDGSKSVAYADTPQRREADVTAKLDNLPEMEG